MLQINKFNKAVVLKTDLNRKITQILFCRIDVYIFLESTYTFNEMFYKLVENATSEQITK